MNFSSLCCEKPVSPHERTKDWLKPGDDLVFFFFDLLDGSRAITWGKFSEFVHDDDSGAINACFKTSVRLCTSDCDGFCEYQTANSWRLPLDSPFFIKKSELLYLYLDFDYAVTEDMDLIGGSAGSVFDEYFFDGVLDFVVGTQDVIYQLRRMYINLLADNLYWKTCIRNNLKKMPR